MREAAKPLGLEQIFCCTTAGTGGSLFRAYSTEDGHFFATCHVCGNVRFSAIIRPERSASSVHESLHEEAASGEEGKGR
jgi:hypothetical protein